MKLTGLTAAIAIIAAATSAFGETITIDAYMERVKRTHPFFNAQALQVDIETWARDRYIGRTDWGLGANTALAYQQPIQSNAFTPTSAVAWTVGAGLDRLFWGNGSRLGVRWQSTFSNQDLPGISFGGQEIPIGPSDFYEHRLFVNYVYPLLQNRGGQLDRLEYELGDFEVQAAQIEALENQENFLFAAGTRFIDWALTVEQIDILKRRRDYEQAQLDRTQRRQRANLADEVDVLRGKDAIKTAEEALIFSESVFKARQAELAVIAQDESMYGLDPAFDIYAQQPMPEIEQAVARLDDHRIVRLLRVRLDQLYKQKDGFDELAKPQLFLTLEGGLQKGETSFFSSWTLDDPNVTAALDYRYPIKNRTAEANLTRNQFEIRQLEKEIESAKLDLESQLRAILIAIAELEKVLVVNQERVATALERTREEERLYNQGRNELQFVIQSRDSVAIAALTYASNAADYQKLVLQYQALMNEILPGP